MDERRCELSESSNPYLPPETQERARYGSLYQGSLGEFLARGALCAVLFLITAGISQLLPELPIPLGSTVAGALRTVFCTGLLVLLCGRLVRCELPGVLFFVSGAGLEFLTSIAGYVCVVLITKAVAVGSLGPYLFVLNLSINMAETLCLAWVFGWLTGRKFDWTVIAAVILLCVATTVSSFFVLILGGVVSQVTSYWIAISMSGSLGLFSTSLSLWYVNRQPAR